jgi:hypothetical protein
MILFNISQSFTVNHEFGGKVARNRYGLCAVFFQYFSQKDRQKTTIPLVTIVDFSAKFKSGISPIY